MKHAVGFVFILISISKVFATVDSLETALLTETRLELKAKLCQKIGLSYERAGQDSVAKDYYFKEYEFYEEFGSDSGRVEALTDVGLLHYGRWELDSAFVYIRQALDLSQQIGSGFWIAGSYNNLGIIHYRKGQYPDCSYFLQKAISEFESIGSYKQAARIKSNLATVYNRIGLYDQSLSLALEVLRDHEEQDADVLKAKVLNTIAAIYNNLNEPQESLKFHEKALSIYVELGDTSRQAISLNNIGRAYKKQGKYELALERFNESLKLKKLIGKSALGTVLGNIGEVYLDLKQYAEAENYFINSIQISRRINDEDPLIEALINLASLYITQQNLLEAEVFLQESRKLAESSNEWEAQKENYQLSKQLYEKMGNYKLALEYADKLKSVSDSILNQDKQWAIAGQSIRYQKEQLEIENKLLRNQQISDHLLLQAKDEIDEKKSNFIIVLIVSTLLLLALAGLLYRRYLEKRNSNQRIKMLMRELHHRVKNNLQILSSLLSLQSSRLEDKTAKQAVKGGEERVNAMMLIHQKLYSEDEVTDIDMREYVTKLTANLMHSYGILRDHIQLSIDVEEFELDVDKAIPLGLIINELVSNAFKYAFEEQEQPRLLVQLKLASASKVNLFIRDNGKGIPGEFDLAQANSFGLKMVNILSKQLKGQIQRNSESGLEYHFTFPI